MRNKTWIWIVLAIIIVVAAGFFFMRGGGGLSTLGNSSLRSLLASGASQKCTFNSSNSNGTIYVGGGRMRGDFTSENTGAEAKSHMIIANDIAYIWIDGTPQGYRMPFEKLNSNSGAQSGGIDADAKVATKCESWQAAEASFTLPTDVTFISVGAPAGDMAPTTNGTGASSGASAGAAASTSSKAPQSYAEQKCAACNIITDPKTKAECKASFDCR